MGKKSHRREFAEPPYMSPGNCISLRGHHSRGDGVVTGLWRAQARLRSVLFAGVTCFALAAASGAVRADDLLSPRFIAMTPSPVAVNQWRVWVEGGAFDTLGDTVHFGDPATDVGSLPWGIEGAAGFDYRLAATPWHLSSQFRYGATRNSGPFTRDGTVDVPSFLVFGPFSIPVGTEPFPSVATGLFNNKEFHWLWDLAVGRDNALGIGGTQWNVGIRVAQIAAKTSGWGNFVAPTSFVAPSFLGVQPATFAFEQTTGFAGAGPRVSVDGSVPLGGAWTFDYSGGASVLFGGRSIKSDVVGNAPAFGIDALNVSSNAAVVNLDGQAGLSYWLTPYLKVSASYRFDGYWGALKTINGDGASADANRFYSGPMLRLTGLLDGEPSYSGRLFPAPAVPPPFVPGGPLVAPPAAQPPPPLRRLGSVDAGNSAAEARPAEPLSSPTASPAPPTSGDNSRPPIATAPRPAAVVADLDGLTGIPDVEDDPPAAPIVRRRPPLSSASAQEPKKSQRDKNRDKRMLSICTGC